MSVDLKKTATNGHEKILIPQEQQGKVCILLVNMTYFYIVLTISIKCYETVMLSYEKRNILTHNMLGHQMRI